MTLTQQVARRRTGEPDVAGQSQAAAQARESEFALAPPADIYEDEDGIILVLDMPGVVKDRLTVKADRNGLVVEGDAAVSLPKGMEAVYAEIRSARYERSFTLSGELDADRIEASMKDGVLTIRIPKRAESKPKRIEIRTA